MRGLDFSHPRHSHLQESDPVSPPALFPLLRIQELSGKSSTRAGLVERVAAFSLFWVSSDCILGPGRLSAQSPSPQQAGGASKEEGGEEIQAFAEVTEDTHSYRKTKWSIEQKQEGKKKGSYFYRKQDKFLAIFQRQHQGIVLKVQLGENWSLKGCKEVNSFFF